MTIHVVQPGETIYTIADYYNVSVTRLIEDNGITCPDELVTGQTIVIANPEQTYTVQEGDTLKSIADAYDVTLIQLIRNNPFLLDRKFIYPGETLVIRYKKGNGRISTNGYANPYIDRAVLKKTLPFLTYLSIFGYRSTAEADIIGIDDTEIIQIAKDYGVAPIMLLSTLTGEGTGSIEIDYGILYNQTLVDRHIDKILYILAAKGYYGLNMTFQYINAENRHIYEIYITKLASRLNKEGYKVFVTITPSTVYNVNQITFERIHYSEIAQRANGMTIMTYNWGYSYGPPAPVSSNFMLREFLNYAVTLIPPGKIDIGLPIIGYDWELPYVVGFTKANSLTLESCINLARDVGAVILFDEISQSPYFQYTINKSGILIRHIVWFIDARSINALVQLVPEYGFNGTGIWNIMNYYPQMWPIINSQFEIETVNITPPMPI